MPSPHPRDRRAAALLAAAGLAVLLAAGACASDASAPVTSFDPTTPCTTDGQQPGAYPELEALLPDAWESAAPANVDSGRTCTKQGLGTLAGHGIEGLRFAGATWDMGGTGGMTLAVFEADRLDPELMVEFYEAGARTARRTDKYQVTDTTVGGKPAKRLDVLGSDGTGQTVVAWPGDEPGRVKVLLAADVGDATVARVLEAFGSR